MRQGEATTGKLESGRAKLSDGALDEYGQWFSAQGEVVVGAAAGGSRLHWGRRMLRVSQPSEL